MYALIEPLIQRNTLFCFVFFFHLILLYFKHNIQGLLTMRAIGYEVMYLCNKLSQTVAHVLPF